MCIPSSLTQAPHLIHVTVSAQGNGQSWRKWIHSCANSRGRGTVPEFSLLHTFLHCLLNRGVMGKKKAGQKFSTDLFHSPAGVSRCLGKGCAVLYALNQWWFNSKCAATKVKSSTLNWATDCIVYWFLLSSTTVLIIKWWTTPCSRWTTTQTFMIVSSVLVFDVGLFDILHLA